MIEPATDFERAWGIPPERVGLSRPTNRDLAVLARRGGAYLVRHAHARVWDPSLLRDAMALAAPTGRAAMLPEAAFDWPIYRAAMGLDQPAGKGARK